MCLFFIITFLFVIEFAMDVYFELFEYIKQIISNNILYLYVPSTAK